MPDTQKLTIKDINCGNCNNKNTEKCPLYHEMMSTERKKPWNWWVPTGSDVIMAVTETVGCASHPLALQVLAAPSITELEKKKSLTHKNECQSRSWKRWELAGWEKEGFEEAIKLLKGE